MDRTVTPRNRLSESAAILLGLVLLLAATGCGLRRAPANPSGTLEADEIRLSTALAGRVLELRVTEGDSVRAGDTLLVLDASLPRLQRAQSAAGLVTLDARRQRVEAQILESRAGLRLSESTLARVQALRQAGSATEQQLDESRSQQEQARARLAGLGHEREALLAERQSLEAALAVQDRQLRDTVLLAPSPGRVLERYTMPGEWLNPGQSALLLADLRQLDLRFYLAEMGLSRIQLGQELQVRVDAWPDEIFHGRVVWIASEAEFTPKNTQTREARAQLVYAARLALDNPAGRLMVGMPAEVLPEGGDK